MQITDDTLLLEIIRTSPIGICLLNAETLEIEVNNEPYLAVAGKTREQTIGKYFWDVFPEVRHIFEADMETALNGETVRGRELGVPLMRFGKLESIVISFDYVPVRNQAGAVTKIAVWVLEYTQEVKYRTKIEILNEELQIANSEFALTNEELAATNEELINVQEELRILNLELQKRTLESAENEARFRSMAEGTDILIDVSDEHNNTVYLNRAWTEFTGKLVQELLPLGWLNLIHAEDRKPYLRLYLSSFKERIPFKAEFRMMTAKGVYHWVFTQCSVRYHSDGSFAGYIGATTDITEQKQQQLDLERLNQEISAANIQYIAVNESLHQAQKSTEAQREQLYQFIMQAPAGICILRGPDLVYELINPAYQMLLPGRLLLNRSVFKALPELVGTPLQQKLLEVYQTGESYYVDELLIPVAEYENGPTVDRYFTFNYLPRRNEVGKVDGILDFVYEVTEQVLTRKATEKLNTDLQLSEESLRLSVEAAKMGSYSVDLTSGVVTVNDYCRKIFGLPPDSVFMAQAGLSMIEQDEQRVQQAMNTAIQNDTVFDEQYRILRANDNNIRWIRSVGRASVSALEHRPLFHGILLDVTELKQDEQRKNDFIGMVSHELKTPLTSVKGYVQILHLKAKKGEDAFTSNMLDKANNQLTKMATMISGFLDVSRLESGKIHIERKRFDLAPQIKETEEEIVASISSHHVVFAPVEEIWVDADRDKIGQVINNLISNAVKYSLAGSTINVACVTEGSNALISVKDEGRGISSQDLPKLFERYYRVQEVKETTISGFGIGLYLSHEIVERHGGQIWAESEAGKGSTFYFTLPVVV